LGPPPGSHSDKVSADHSDKIRTNAERLPGSPGPATATKPVNISDAEAAAEHLPPAAAVDLLDKAVRHVRPILHLSTPVGERLRCLWAAVVAARDLGASDILQARFLKLARETDLFADLGRRAEEDLRHVIRWAMLNRNPFQ
jgi:hypothetical protein